MSYDVTVNGQTFNYTYNMHQFFRDFGVHPYDDLDGKTVMQVRAKISDALLRIHNLPIRELRLKYDAENGWGNVPGALSFLYSIRDACQVDPIVRAT